MGTCPSPCDDDRDGVCVSRGSQNSCEGQHGLTLEQLVQLAASVEKVRVTPGYLDKFDIPIQGLRSALSLQESDGVIEITGRLP